MNEERETAFVCSAEGFLQRFAITRNVSLETHGFYVYFGEKAVKFALLNPLARGMAGFLFWDELSIRFKILPAPKLEVSFEPS